MRGLNTFLGTAFVVVILISSVSDGSINIGGVVSNGVDYFLTLVDASISAMRASE